MSRNTSTAALLTVTAALISATGCHYRSGHACCPTDARSIAFSCAGEDAVRKGPCGPDASYAGYHPTSWSYWPAGWDQYGQGRCNTCPRVEGPGQPCDTCQPGGEAVSVARPVSTQASVPSRGVVDTRAEQVSILEAAPVAPATNEAEENPAVAPVAGAAAGDDLAVDKVYDAASKPAAVHSAEELPSLSPARRSPYEALVPPAPAEAIAEPAGEPRSDIQPQPVSPAAGATAPGRSSGVQSLFPPPQTPTAAEPQPAETISEDVPQPRLFGPPG